MTIEITPDIANALGFYVYAYIDPRDESVFYIGKGVGARATDHLSDKTDSEKVARIKSIIAEGFEPRIDIVAHKLRDDLESSRVEAALIELIGVNQLTNAVKGRFSYDYPRRTLADFSMEHAPQEVDVTDPALLIRINRQFKYEMSAEALYESTRGIWVIGERRNRANLAMAVYAGIIREVYEIESWHRAGTTPYKTRDQLELAKQKNKRWEFIGRVASQPARSRYVGHSVAHLFRAGQQSPIVGIGLNGGRSAPSCSLNDRIISRHDPEVLRGSDGNVVVTTDSYFKRPASKDTTQYVFDGKKLGKGRLALAIVKRHVEANPEITFAELEKAFPKSCQGSNGVIATADQANQTYSESGRKRHFLNPEDLIQLQDVTAAVSSQWGTGNIDRLLKRAGELGYNVQAVR